jgi:hypothetical protein
MLKRGAQMIFPPPWVASVNAASMEQRLTRSEEHQRETILNRPSFRNDVLGLP